VGLCAALVVSACASDEGALAVAPPLTLEILSVSGPRPLLQGSVLLVDTRAIAAGDGVVRVQVRDAASDGVFILDELIAARLGTVHAFSLTPEAIATLGVGEHTLKLTLMQGTARSAVFTTTHTVATELVVSLSEVGQGTVNREGSVVVRGEGLLAPGEGTIQARMVGTFSPTGSTEMAVDARLPITLTQLDDRTRATLRITTDLGGARPGRFSGTVAFVSLLLNGSQSTSQTQSVVFEVQPPVVLTAPSGPLYLGQLVDITGVGFLGAEDRPGEATLLRLEGNIDNGEWVTPFGPVEVVAPFVNGETALLPLEYKEAEERLVSSLFGIARGRFTGTVTPITIAGTEEVTGVESPLTLELGGVRQTAVVHFLPGFFESLHLFGLALPRDAVTDAVLARLADIYSDYNASFVSEAPKDMLPNSVATIEVGGPDPNGLGALGYDNTPGKDVGNLRLGDKIGGENAATQVDGSPGYGGVFIESFLWWSTHPGLNGVRPQSAPPADPMFDSVFDPVRSAPATLAEAAGQGDPARVAAVQRAIRALSSLVAETTAHEFGHSLGLAEPYGSKSTYHNKVPGAGCLMDSGQGRPLGERMREPGYDETRFCGDSPDYLTSILPL
jgi:hypothetical protein